MIAHDELVAGQRIERVLELLGLRDGEVAGVRHAVELALQQRLTGGLGQEGEGLRQHERERRGEQAVEHPDHARRRVFLDAQHRADARAGRQAVLDRLGAEEQPRGRQHLD